MAGGRRRQRAGWRRGQTLGVMDDAQFHGMRRRHREERDRWDVLGLGCTAVDELLFVPRYPGRDARQPLHRRDRQCGGLTATALVAAARLGARTAYAGRLGDAEDSVFVRRAREAEGVDLSELVRRRNARPVHAGVVAEAETQSRPLLYDVS